MINKKRYYIEKIALLYREHGIKPLSMDAIATLIGLSKKSLYNYFESKEKMVDAVFQFHFKRLRDGFSTIVSEKINAIDKLLKVSDLLYHFYGSFSEPMLEDLRQFYPYLSHKNKDTYQKHLATEIEHNIQEGIQQGLYIKTFDVQLITHHFVLSLQLLLTEQSLPNNKITPATAYKQLILYHIRGIASNRGMQKLSAHLENTSLSNDNPQKIA